MSLGAVCMTMGFGMDSLDFVIQLLEKVFDGNLNGNLTSQSCQSLPLCQIKLLLTKKVRIYSITSKDGVSIRFQ